MPQTATVDDELEKYAKPPAHADEDELEKYATKPQAPQPGSLDEYLSRPYSASNAGSKSPTVDELPGATPRLKEATGGKATKPVTQFEKEHTPEETGPWARVKEYGKDAGKLALSLGGGALAPLETHFSPAMVSDAATEYASRRIPNVGQTGLAGGRSAPYSALATIAPLAGVDPTGMEASAEHGDPMGVLTHAAAQATPIAAAEAARIPAVQKVARTVRDVGDVIPSKADIALKLRQTEGPNEGKLGPGTEATARLAGAGAGHLLNYAGIPLVGELGGYAVGPKIADALIPKLPVDRPLKTPIGASLPDAGEFYEQKAADRATRGKEQEKLDKANEEKLTEAEKARQKELADAERLKTMHGMDLMKRGAEQEKLNNEAAAKENSLIPKIIKPTEGEPVREGNEGRAATWTNEKVLDEAGKGNRVGITQAVLRGLPLPENARYVMGDPDTARAVLNPREVTRFTPEGVPIRNKDNPLTVDSPLIPTIKRTPRAVPPPEPAAPAGPALGVLQFPGPLPESTPLAPAKAVGETPQATTQPVPKAEAPTLLEPLPPLGIKPLENAKPIMEAAKEEAAQPAPKSVIPKVGEEAEPEEIHIKGVTAKEAKPVKAKATPIEKRFTSEQIADAEGMLRAEAEAMQSGGKAGKQFIEDAPWESTTAAGRNAKKGERMGGHWIGGQSGGRDIFPFLKENPKVNPVDILKALRNKDSAAYIKLMEKAVDFNRRNAPPADQAYDFVRGLGLNPDAELEGIQEDVGGKEPTFNPEEIEEQANAKPKEQSPTSAMGLIQALKESKQGGILPGMEAHVAKQNEGAAKVAGENLTAEVNKPKDISAAAGRMETMSPLFRGTEASPQKEIFGNAPTPNAPPAAIQQAIEGTDWKFEGKNNLGLYTIQEPGTKIRISLFERDLHPEFIRRKIAEKEKQFGAPENPTQ